ncbi:MAG: hypothetical protein ACTSQD_05660 [Promethearchaeota archaeon]
MIDNNGISLIETTFKDLNTIQDNNITNFFDSVNKTIDSIQKAISSERKLNDSIRVLESELSAIIIYYHAQARIFLCSISDADDDIEKIKETLRKIGERFWKKHQSDLETFRTTSMEKNRIQTFNADIENLSLGGRVAEIFPKLLINTRSVLERIQTMGIINDFEFQIALNCTGKNSPLKISRLANKTRNEIYEVLKKLEQLDIILL